VTAAVDAVLDVDLQRALVDGEGAVPGAAELLSRVRTTLDRARSAGALVVHLQDNGISDRLIHRGSRGWELALPPAPGEAVPAKDADDGFLGTGLADLLDRHGVTRVAEWSLGDCVETPDRQDEVRFAAPAGRRARGSK
jgi:nicotinamidase-related amidase